MTSSSSSTVIVDETAVTGYDAHMQRVLQLDLLDPKGLTLRRGAEGGPSRVRNLAAPQDPLDAASKEYVDAVVRGLALHPTCAAAAGEACILPAGLCLPGVVIDRVSLVAGDRVLLLAQGDPRTNGVYVVAAGGEPPTRASDLADGNRADAALMYVIRGATHADRAFICTGVDVVVGRDPLLFRPFGGGGGGRVEPGFGIHTTKTSSDATMVSVDPTTVATLGAVRNTFTGELVLTAGTAATSLDSGALRVAGGVAIAGDLFVRSTYNVSDVRLKRDIVPLGDAALSHVRALRGCAFRWAANDRPDVGLLAQEVLAHIPLCAHRDPVTDLHAVEYSRLIPYLIESIKTLARRCESLEEAMERPRRRRRPETSRKTDCVMNKNKTNTDANESQPLPDPGPAVRRSLRGHPPTHHLPRGRVASPPDSTGSTG